MNYTWCPSAATNVYDAPFLIFSNRAGIRH